MSKKYIISDLHFGHKNILKYAGSLRGGTTSEEHDQWLIEQINSVVKKNDLLYVLGDVAFDVESLKLVSKIKAGNRILVRGNHDVCDTKEYLKYFATIQGLISFRGIFWLSHAPIHPAELRGRLNIHGHVHQNSILDMNYLKVEGVQDVLDSRYINACVEMSYGVPQSLDDLFEKHKTSVYEARKKLRDKVDL